MAAAEADDLAAERGDMGLKGIGREKAAPQG